MSKLVLNGDTSGSVTLDAPAVSGTTTLTLPTTSGTVLTTASTFGGTGPAFSVYRGSNQSVSSGVITKVQLNTETFDTASAFDSTTNFRFTPLVAGYYQVNGVIRYNGTNLTEAQAAIFKNGSAEINGSYNVYSAQSVIFSSVSGLTYLNGSTDYLELFAYTVGTTPILQFVSQTNTAVFSGSLVRSA